MYIASNRNISIVSIDKVQIDIVLFILLSGPRRSPILRIEPRLGPVSRNNFISIRCNKSLVEKSIVSIDYNILNVIL